MKKIIIVLLVIVSVVALAVGAIFTIRHFTESDTVFVVNDTLPDGGGKSVRVLLLGGQSNASGCSRDDCLRANVSEEKYEEYSAGYDNVYINFFSSGNNQSHGFVKSASLQGEAGGFFGPELGMAEWLSEAYPDETIFIIKYAWGGTELYDRWLSPSSNGKIGTLYKEFVNFVDTSLRYLVSKNYDVKIEGMCWMQGESDSFSVENATDYEGNLTNLIKDLRKRYNCYASDDGIAFIDATIAQNPVYWVYCDLVNASKQNVAKAMDNVTLIDTNAEGLSCNEEPADKPDLAHYDSLSEIKLGHLFADAISKYFD